MEDEKKECVRPECSVQIAIAKLNALVLLQSGSQQTKNAKPSLGLLTIIATVATPPLWMDTPCVRPSKEAADENFIDVYPPIGQLGRAL